MRKKSLKTCFYISVFMLMTLIFFRVTFSLAASEPLSSARLITNAYKSGEIDRETYIIQKLKSYFSPNKVDPAFRSYVNNEPTREITILLDEAVTDYDSFSDESKTYLNILLRRPDDTNYDWPWDANPDFYLPAPVSAFEPTAADYPNIGGKFKFWYVTHDTADGAGHKHTTTLDFVKKMASAFETVYKTEITDMGYAAPPNDPGGADYGGDTKFDVYVMNCGFGSVYGYVSREGLDTGNSYYSFMVMDNDFTEFVTATITADEAMQVTAAHEYHHVVQNGINGLSNAWYKESTATWMEDQVYDSIDDNLQYLNGTGGSDFFYNPEKSLDDTSGLLEYAHWIWNEYLETKWDQATIKSVWGNLDPAGNNNAVDAIVTMLTAKGSSLKDAFTEFAAKNYAQKGFYKDHLRYDEVPNFSGSPHTLDYSTATSHKVDEQTKNVNNLAAKYYKFVPGATLKKPVMLSISVNGADGKDVNAIAIAKKKDGSFVEYPFALDATTKEGEVGISGFSSENIEAVKLVLVNYSKAEDNLEIKYEAELMKGFTFVIDDTGSMGEEIAAAKAAATKVLDDNKANDVKRFYTLISFKDGNGTIRGQSSDEDTMKAFVNALGASGGAGCPESSLLSIRQAADLSEGSDIMMMTDADSNSYGVDYTDATWGEVLETIFKLLETNSRLHCIIYSSDCLTEDSSEVVEGTSFAGGEILQDQVYCQNDDIDSIITEASPQSIGGYNMASTESGGLFFHISTAETETVTEMILRAATSDSTIAYYDGDGLDTYTVPVDSTVTQLQIVMNSDAGSSLTLEVKNPSGSVVDDTTAGVSVLSAGGNNFYLIEDPALASGDWTATVSGTGTYRFSAEGSTSNPMDYTGDTSLGVGGTLNLECNLREAVSGISFELVKLDGSDPMSVTLTSTDDLNYTGTQVMDTVESYRFKVTGGGNYQRMYPANITIGNLDVIAPPAEEATAGTSLTHTFQVKNLGTAEDTYVISASSSLGWSDLSGIASSVTIAAGGTEEISIPVSVPTDATSGQIDELSLQAYSETNSMINDTDETETRIATVYDFNGDGEVDVIDIMMIASHWNTSEGDSNYDATYDLDGDGDIDTTDVMVVVAQWGWTV